MHTYTHVYGHTHTHKLTHTHAYTHFLLISSVSLHSGAHSGCVRPAQEKVSQRDHSERTTPCLAVGGCWGRETQFSAWKHPLLGCSCSSGWPYIHVHKESIIWTSWVLKWGHEIWWKVFEKLEGEWGLIWPGYSLNKWNSKEWLIKKCRII